MSKEGRSRETDVTLNVVEHFQYFSHVDSPLDNVDRLWRNDAMAVFKMIWLRGFEFCFVETSDMRAPNVHGIRSILKPILYREEPGSLRCR